MKTTTCILLTLAALALPTVPARAQNNGNGNGEDTIPIPAEAAAALAELIPLLDTNSAAADTGSHTNEAFHREAREERARLAPLRATNGIPGAGDLTPPTPPDQVVKDGEAGLRFNFRGAPLEMVLNYLSDAAGFVIVPETDIRGRVDIVSAQPLTKDEAIDLLGTVLGKSGYAVLREGRTLTIVTKEDARKRDIPVRTGYEPATIPKNDQLVTQIIPVRFINAVQLARDLAPLIPASATMTANEGGNALVITDTQASIRRMAEIIKALDTTVSSLSSVKVFALRYADAKTVADMVKEVFASTDSGRSSGGGGRRGEFRFGGGPFGGMFGGGGDPNATTGRPGASRVVATADDRSNSLVVSAPDDLMPTIEQLVASVDTNVEDVTEIRVFRLEHADPQETADLITSLFPDTTSNNNRNQQRGGGGFFRGPWGGGNETPTASASERLMRQSRVAAVPDNRTRSIVVTAARATMTQIEAMVKQLDSDPARKQKVFVFEVQNTDPTTVQETLDSLFSGQNVGTARSRTTTGAAGTQLNTRAQRQNQNISTGNRNTTTGFGTTGGTRGFGN